MDKDLLNLLKIPSDRLDSINAVLLDPNEQVISDFLKGGRKIWHSGGDKPSPYRIPSVYRTC